MGKYLIFAAFFLFISCESSISNKSSGQIVGYELTDIEDSELQQAVKQNQNGILIERGHVNDGIKEGVWTIFHADDSNFPKEIITYVNGIKNGPHYKFTNRGQIEEVSNYLNNKLHGLYGKYRFGRAEVTTEYQNGQFHGTHKEFFDDGKVQKMVEFKDGKQDGNLRYYDQNGNITIEYQYKNGEKVAGGIIGD